MQRQNKIFPILTNKSGVSLIFVLAIMMLLMAIGTSALAAASAAAGAGMSKQAKDQLNLYAESIHKSMMYNLQTSEKASDKSKTLGGQILALIYEEAEAASAPGENEAYQYPPEEENPLRYSDEYVITTVIDDVTITPKTGSGTLEQFEKIDQEGMIRIVIEPYVRVNEGDLPRNASISAKVTVIVTLKYREESTEYQKKSLTSAVTYSCTRGFLEADTTGEMIIQNAGDWEFVSYEKLDH